FFFQAEDGIRDWSVTGVQTCALPISLATANDAERAGILASFVEEAKALAGLYHPNVANIIDRGISEGAPFLVLEYLIGADLKQYAAARPMSLFELRQVVLDACAGLSALHTARLVHRHIT